MLDLARLCPDKVCHQPARYSKNLKLKTTGQKFNQLQVDEYVLNRKKFLQGRGKDSQLPRIDF